VTRVSNLVFAELDSVCGTHAIHGKADTVFARSINAGHHLEHFHVYEPDCTRQKSEDSLEMHTDDGLFIALIPPIFIDADSLEEIDKVDPATGFFIEDAQGKVTRPNFARDGDVIVFMMGQGATAWAGKCTSMRPVPHALVMSDSCWLNRGGRVLRSWYGRMFQAPRDAIDEETNLTYGELHSRKVSAVLGDGDSMSAGCTPSGDVSVRDLEQGCAKGEMLCWMQCRPWSNDSGCSEGLPPESYKCESPSGFLWQSGDTHCPTCRPNCLEGRPTASGDVICNGYGTAMYMLGFSSGIDAEDNCVVLLFGAAILNTPVKLAFASIGVFLCWHSYRTHHLEKA